MVPVVSSVQRRCRIRHDLVVGDIVSRYAIDVDRCITKDHNRTRSQVAEDRDVENVVAESPAVGPATRNGTGSESLLDGADECVAAEDTQPMKTVVMRVPRQPGGSRRQVHTDHIGNEDPDKIGSVGLEIRRCSQYRR